MGLQIQFLGGAGTVTGSKYLLEFEGQKVLIDCGMFQGSKVLREQNWQDFPIDPKRIDAVVLTHAHIDHSGYVPRLVQQGFRGKVHATHATLELCRLLLPDAGRIQEEEAGYLTRKRFSKHDPALPLFTENDAIVALRQFVGHPYRQKFEIGGMSFKFFNMGHILGAAAVVVEAGGVRVGFSGDVGRREDPIFNPPENLPPVDYLLVESTYGDRQHPAVDLMSEIESLVQDAFTHRRVVLVPAFAVGRVQSLLHVLSELRQAGRLPNIPIYVNSPMATAATRVFQNFSDIHKLTPAQCDQLDDEVIFVKSVEDSKILNTRSGPMIILSASGMATGGRVLHHLKAFAPDPNNVILISGFQAEGTRGRDIQEGAAQIKIHGGLVPLRAQVRTIDGISAHADRAELLAWLKESSLRPKKVFVVHGEARASESFAQALRETFQWSVEIPTPGQKVALT